MKSIILLHGALGAEDQLKPLSIELIEKGYTVYTLSFSGHGGKAFEKDFSIQLFSNELNHFITTHQLIKPNVFGYSMGGYVALYLAKQDPDKLNKIITLGTKFNWTKQIAENEIKNLNAETIINKVPNYAKALEQRHGVEWKLLLSRTAEMMIKMGENNPLSLTDFSNIKNEVLIGIGDKDQMVSLSETSDVYKSLPNAQMYMLPKTKHPIEAVNLKLLTEIINQFITE